MIPIGGIYIPLHPTYTWISKHYLGHAHPSKIEHDGI